MTILFALLTLFSTARAEIGPGDPVPPKFHRGILVVETGAPTLRLLIGPVEYTLKSTILAYPQNKGIDLETMDEIRVFFGDEDVVTARPLGKAYRPRYDD